MRKWYLLLWAASAWSAANGQSVGIGTTTPDPSAALDITSSTQGFLPPTMTAAQRTAITRPAGGLLIYQADGTPGFYYYNGGEWMNLGNQPTVGNSGPPPPSQQYGLTYTFAGSGSQGSDQGLALVASFNIPTGVAADAGGNIYIADKHNQVIRKIDAGGTVTTLAGSGTAGFADGQGAAASFNMPAGVAVDLAGNVYVADQNNQRIRKITPKGLVTTIAGSGSIGNINGTASVASFNYPSGVAVDKAGNVYVADVFNNEIRRVGTDGLVAIIAGYTAPGSADGTGTDASFNLPQGITISADGNLYIADQNNNEIRQVTPAGVVKTFAGSTTPGQSDGTGAAASFNGPVAIAADPAGNLYISDGNNNKIRKLTPTAVATTLSGTGAYGMANGSGSSATFNTAYGIAVAPDGNVLVADSYNNLIRKISTH